MAGEWDVLDDQTWWETWDKDADRWKEIPGDPGKPTWIGPWQTGGDANARKVRRVVYANGQIWESFDDRPLSYSKTDPQLATQFRTDKHAEEEASKPAKPSTFTSKGGDVYEYTPGSSDAPRRIYDEPTPPTAIAGPTVREFPDGSLRQYDANSQSWAVIGQPTTDPEEKALRRRLLEAQVASAERGPAGAQRAPRYPEEEELARLNVEKARRDLLDSYTRADQDRFSAIENIRAKLAAGTMEPGDADRQMGLVNANYEAALKGTTPFQMEQKRQEQDNWHRTFDQTRETNRQNLAGNILDRRAQVAGTMGQGLLSGLLGAYGRLRTSNNAPPMPDPLAMAQGFADRNTGGDEMGELARSVLMGALGGR